MATRTIDLNRATADELMEAGIGGLDEKTAAELIEYRDEYGPLSSWEDLKEIPGVTQDMIDEMQTKGVVLGSGEAGMEDTGSGGPDLLGE